MKDHGPLAKWETEDGYLKYLLYLEDKGFMLHKRDLAASVSHTADSVRGYTLADAIHSAEKKIKPAEKQLVRVY